MTKLSDKETLDTVARLGRVTIRWHAPAGCKVGINSTVEQLERLFNAGALDRETYRVKDGEYYAGDLETVYFPAGLKTAPIPAWADARAAYPGERETPAPVGDRSIKYPDSIAPDVWRKIPPAARATVEILRERGHTVTARINRNGSPRYSVDGRREMDAATVSRIFKID